MATQHVFEGHCLCGKVGIKLQAESNAMSVCHCSMCRTWAGGPLFAAEAGPGALQFNGEEHITVYPSSDWAERGFCKHCGTNLFYRLKSGEMHAVSVGLFGDTQDWAFEQQIFIDEKPAYYAFANQTGELTGAEVFAQFAPSEGSD